ncbi:hypothetical protein BLNAU_1370 [Blattamonas nauphoetae]|uniref:Uncharacterized protein n=1 Tax=Blattamonas nauphoetae TaxID=2049346 RepID=A0ABQ9YJH9_9EUKA|nr:hypothetical protein BLNAU_1370 [Blattamonas nauphoetae]
MFDLVRSFLPVWSSFRRTVGTSVRLNPDRAEAVLATTLCAQIRDSCLYSHTAFDRLEFVHREASVPLRNNGSLAAPPALVFSNVPSSFVFTVNHATPPNWIVVQKEAAENLHNIVFNQITEIKKTVTAVYAISTLLVSDNVDTICVLPSIPLVLPSIPLVLPSIPLVLPSIPLVLPSFFSSPISLRVVGGGVDYNQSGKVSTVCAKKMPICAKKHSHHSDLRTPDDLAKTQYRLKLVIV